MNSDAKFEVVEVAYWRPGKGWGRAVVKTAKALEKLLAKLEEQGVSDIRTRPFEA